MQTLQGGIFIFVSFCCLLVLARYFGTGISFSRLLGFRNTWTLEWPSAALLGPPPKSWLVWCARSCAVDTRWCFSPSSCLKIALRPTDLFSGTILIVESYAKNFETMSLQKKKKVQFAVSHPKGWAPKTKAAELCCHLLSVGGSERCQIHWEFLFHLDQMYSILPWSKVPDLCPNIELNNLFENFHKNIHLNWIHPSGMDLADISDICEVWREKWLPVNYCFIQKPI